MQALLMLLIIPVAGLAGSTGDYARWNHAAANTSGSWTSAAEAAVRATDLPRLVPRDVTLFCPAYPGLTAEERVKMWVFWMSALAEQETTNFDPKEDFEEKKGARTANGSIDVSRGLFQLSTESASNPHYGCGHQTIESLRDPVSNIQCAVKTISFLIRRDGVVGTHVSSSPPTATGAAKVFGTLWPGKSNHPREAIVKITRAFPLCARPSSTTPSMDKAPAE